MLDTKQINEKEKLNKEKEKKEKKNEIKRNDRIDHYQRFRCSNQHGFDITMITLRKINRRKN